MSLSYKLCTTQYAPAPAGLTIIGCKWLQFTAEFGKRQTNNNNMKNKHCAILPTLCWHCQKQSRAQQNVCYAFLSIKQVGVWLEILWLGSTHLISDIAVTQVPVLASPVTSDFRPPQTSADICIGHGDLGWKNWTTRCNRFWRADCSQLEYIDIRSVY